VTNSDDLQRRQLELLEALRREVAELAAFLKVQGRVGESVVRAVTNLATGLQAHAEEHLRWMQLQEQRHDEVIAGLVTAQVSPKPNGHALGATGMVPISSQKPDRKDVSASIAIGESRLDISEEHLKIAKATALKWVLALLGMAASAGAAWLAGHVR
jgi:hypothetical protein